MGSSSRSRSSSDSLPPGWTAGACAALALTFGVCAPLLSAAILIGCLGSSPGCSRIEYLPAEYDVERLDAGDAAPFEGYLLTVAAFEKLYRLAQKGRRLGPNVSLTDDISTEDPGLEDD